jgi:hypothetical protein
MMAAIWVLALMQGVLLRRPLQVISKWVNTHQLSKTIAVSWDKLELRRRPTGHGRTINGVEVDIEVV